MTDNLRDRIAAVQSDHQPAYNGCFCGWEYDPVVDDGHFDHVADAVIAALAAARTITTADQLAALPFLAVVREVYTSDAGWEHSLIWEHRSGEGSWACIAAPITPYRTVPNLPAVVLWPTDWNADV